MPSQQQTYYNLTEASEYLNIRQVKLYKYLTEFGIKAVSLANMQGLFITWEHVQFLQIQIKAESKQNHVKQSKQRLLHVR